MAQSRTNERQCYNALHKIRTSISSQCSAQKNYFVTMLGKKRGKFRCARLLSKTSIGLYFTWCKESRVYFWAAFI